MKLTFTNKKGFVVGELHYSVGEDNKVYFHDNDEQDAERNLIRIFDDFKDANYCYVVSTYDKDIGKINNHIFDSIPLVLNYVCDKTVGMYELLDKHETLLNGEDCCIGKYAIERIFIN
jgi:hypothetical protein